MRSLTELERWLIAELDHTNKEGPNDDAAHLLIYIRRNYQLRKPEEAPDA